MCLGDLTNFQNDLLEALPNLPSATENRKRIVTTRSTYTRASWPKWKGISTRIQKVYRFYRDEEDTENAQSWTESTNRSNQRNETNRQIRKPEKGFFTPKYFKPLLVPRNRVGEIVSEDFDQLKGVQFPLPYDRLLLGTQIGKGKYGHIVQARTEPPGAIQNEFGGFREHVVKCMTDDYAFQLELAAYKKMSQTLNIKLRVDDKLRSFISQNRSSSVALDHIDFGGGNFHPLINRLLASTSRYAYQLFDEYANSTYFISKIERRGKTKQKFFFLLYDLAPGGDLSTVALRCLKRSMTINEAIFYVAEIAEALTWLHSIGIVHQDLKLENVLVRADGHILVTDFGLAHVLKGQPGSSFPGNVRCTSNHMPPEITEYRTGTIKVWHAVDWYSLGVILYRLLQNGNYPPVPKTVDMRNPSTWNPRIKGLRIECQSLLNDLLSPSPEHRLGGDKIIGGEKIFSQPGFIGPLLNCSLPLQKDNFQEYLHVRSLHSCGRSIHENLKVLMLECLTNANTNSISKSEKICLPSWVADLRRGISERRLVPPFKPERSQTFSRWLS